MVGALARLPNNFDAFFQLRFDRARAILAVAARKTGRTVALSLSANSFAPCTPLHEIVDAYHFHLADVSFLVRRLLAAPLDARADVLSGLAEVLLEPLVLQPVLFELHRELVFLVFKFALRRRQLVLEPIFKFILFTLQIVYLFLEHLDVQFELLFDLDVVANFAFILLELLLVNLGGQVERLEGASEFRCGSIVALVKALRL